MPEIKTIPKHMCWDEDGGSEEDAVAVEAWLPEEAAEGYASLCYDSTCNEFSVCVRSPDGSLKIFEVTAEVDVNFFAYEKG